MLRREAGVSQVVAAVALSNCCSSARSADAPALSAPRPRRIPPRLLLLLEQELKSRAYTRVLHALPYLLFIKADIHGV